MIVSRSLWVFQRLAELLRHQSKQRTCSTSNARCTGNEASARELKSSFMLYGNWLLHPIFYPSTSRNREAKGAFFVEQQAIEECHLGPTTATLRAPRMPRSILPLPFRQGKEVECGKSLVQKLSTTNLGSQPPTDHCCRAMLIRAI